MTSKDIKDLVHNASNVIAHYWPMTTFVHHNPIRHLEHLPFNQAVQVASKFIGGQGYLSNQDYRGLVKSGRISSVELDQAIKTKSKNENVEISGKVFSHSDIMRAHMLTGITPPATQQIEILIKQAGTQDLVQALAKRLENQSKSRQEIIGKDLSLSQWCDKYLGTDIVEQVNNEMIKWSKAFVDEGHAAWRLPRRGHGFYSAWKSLSVQEWSPLGIKNCGKKIECLPDSAEQALSVLLDTLCIPEDLKENYLSLHLAQQYGWTSYINWRSENDDYHWQAEHKIDLVQYLAIRLFYETELVHQACHRKLKITGTLNEINSQEISQESNDRALAQAWSLIKLAETLEIPPETLSACSKAKLELLLGWLRDFPEPEHGVVWLDAYEAGYQLQLITELKEEAGKNVNTPEIRPLAQMMFCIDVRSEPFRRSLESVGNYETIGFAGFFGLAISSQALDHHHATDQCPAILKPSYCVKEVVREEGKQAFKQHDSKLKFSRLIKSVLNDLKTNIFTPYILVETFGWLFGLSIIKRTIFAGTYKKWQVKKHVPTKLTRDLDEHGHGISEGDQNAAMANILRMMGLTENFARLVVVAGHTSTSDNNPYEAALNCGACGGNSGEPNARLFASIANKAQVRKYLADNGIKIPEDTHFIGAVHNTTTDQVDFYDLEDLPASHKQDLENLQQDLKQAAILTNLVRCSKLPGAGDNLSNSSAINEITRRSADWGETRPEWGLSGNAAFIIGRRGLTKNIDLDGRSFLNSYDYRLDTDGSLLEGILMGPMVVGQWINAEHYFSATDPEVYGSGSKIYHNVVGRIAIMSGPESDLRTGLAWQSVAGEDMTYHEPLRLFVVIEAPCQRISEIVEKQEILKQLLNNKWIHLMAIDHESDKKFYRYQAGPEWIEA